LRKPIAILLLGLLLFTNLECYQFVKLPILFEHFKEHQAGNSQMTFWDFWTMHYSKGLTKDADYNRDQQLPFQTSNVSLIISSAGFILPPTYNVNFSLDLTENSLFTYYPEFVPQYNSADIFQPPRFI
jgi:hypothetical protein